MISIVTTTCISGNFDIRDLRPGQFRDLPMLSQCAKFSTTSFPHRNISIFGHQWWYRCQFSSMTPLKRHLRSPKVTNHFLPITFAAKEVETWKWFHCVSLVKTHRLICNMTYLGHHVTLTWCQIVTLIFRSQQVCVSMRMDEKNTMVPKSTLYH